MNSGLIEEWRALKTGHWLTDLSNGAAFLFSEMKGLNWVGFYLSDGTKLRLGPFQGRVACVEIPFSKGVCGAAWTAGESVIVDDVHDFSGHIVCDPISRSEMVIPFGPKADLFGVLDFDSPLVKRFTAEDRDFAERFCEVLIEDWNGRPWSVL